MGEGEVIYHSNVDDTAHTILTRFSLSLSLSLWMVASDDHTLNSKPATNADRLELDRRLLLSVRTESESGTAGAAANLVHADHHRLWLRRATVKQTAGTAATDRATRWHSATPLSRLSQKLHSAS